MLSVFLMIIRGDNENQHWFLPVSQWNKGPIRPFMGPCSVVNEETALKQKGCWGKSCIFLLLSFFPPSRSSIQSSTLQQFMCRIIVAKVEALRLSATQKCSLHCRGSDWGCITRPLSKQAQESLKWDFTSLCYLYQLLFQSKHCPSPLDNLYQVHQWNKTGSAFHRCCKGKARGQNRTRE